MPRGGARSRSGPPPAEHSQKKDREAARTAKGQVKPKVIDDGEWLTLPREGRTANPPAWPLTQASKRERVLWRALWKKPQGLAWELLGLEYSVAVHARTLARAEEGDSAIGLVNLVRLQSDGLGLTPVGLSMVKWRIARPGAMGSSEGATSAAAAPRSSGESIKNRFKLVAGG
jgi:hypothetical protein